MTHQLGANGAPTVEIRDVPEGTVRTRMALPPLPAGFLGAAGAVQTIVSPDGQWFALWCRDCGREVLIYDLRRQTLAARLESPSGHVVREARFSPDSRWLVVTDGGAPECFFSVFNTTTWERQASARLTGVINANVALAVDPASQRLATAGTQHDSIRIWDLLTGELLGRCSGGGDYDSLTWSPDGRTLISQQAGRLSFWSMTAYRELAHLQISTEQTPLGFTGHGRTLVNLDYDGAVEYLAPPTLTEVDLGTVAGMVFVPPGTYTQGSPPDESHRDADEGPPRLVTLSRGFMIGMFEVTQKDYQEVMGTNPSKTAGNFNRPVETVSWFDATNYCGQLTGRERATGKIPPAYGYRLPTEAEWEYACRAGTTTPFSFGTHAGQGLLDEHAWHHDNQNPGGPQPVGQKLPNRWGLHDLLGNVTEWCQDWYADAYPEGSATDPAGPATGSQRVVRGGAYHNYGDSCRSANRAAVDPSFRNDTIGFRVVLASL